jgi:nucleotide-binding universal stress UspA family protein
LTVKDILLHLQAGETARSSIEFAISLAVQTSAHLTAAGVVIDIAPPASELGSFAPDWDFGSYGIFSQIGETRRLAAEKAYEAFAASVPASVQTEKVMIQSFQEQACDDFARLARHFDFAIIAQGDDETAQDSRPILSAALFTSGRPVFVVPPSHQGPARLDQAMVCWDGGAQAARALADSLPLLARAKKVEVVCVTGESESRKNLKGFDITRHLARHRIEATLRELPDAQGAGAAILAHAQETGADYLVMGGYGHWRLGELIFGGATRTLLAATPKPVFMAH